jgi:hypothetical protein
MLALKPSRGRKMFYASNVDGRYGFPELSRIAKDHGADIAKGDVVVFDNPNQNRRKALIKSPSRGIMLVHVKLSPQDLRETGPYIPLADRDGLIRRRDNYLN